MRDTSVIQPDTRDGSTSESSSGVDATRGDGGGDATAQVDDASADAASADAADHDDASNTSVIGAWSNWPMPNPLGYANPQSYTVSPNGTVVDNVTGLIWQQTGPAEVLDWSQAQSYCDALVLGGSDNWRLPSRIELVSLIDFSRFLPAVDVAAFTATGTDTAATDWFWSQSAYVGAPPMRWAVDVSAGFTGYLDRTAKNRVRCVR